MSIYPTRDEIRQFTKAEAKEALLRIVDIENQRQQKAASTRFKLIEPALRAVRAESERILIEERRFMIRTDAEIILYRQNMKYSSEMVGYILRRAVGLGLLRLHPERKGKFKQYCPVIKPKEPKT